MAYVVRATCFDAVWLEPGLPVRTANGEPVDSTWQLAFIRDVAA